MRFCISQMQPILAASKSDPFKTYEVTLRPMDSKYPKCTCIAFAMARNKARKGLTNKNVDVEAVCKHIKAVMVTACNWAGGSDTTCPQCGSETIGEDSTVTLAPILIEPGEAPTIGMMELRPMLATEVSIEKIGTYLEDDSWWGSQKVDGQRVLIHVQDGKLAVLGRGGQPSQHASRFTQPYYSDITNLPDCVIDGELVGDTFWIFDLPYCDTYKVVTDTPLAFRLEALDQLFKAWNPGDAYKLLPTAKVQVEKERLFDTCRDAGGEGLMFKDVKGVYSPGGRTSAMLKVKFVKSADVVVTAVGTGGKTNYKLAVYRDGSLVEIGGCSAIGKTVVEVGAVIEVRYLYLGANEKLYQPRMMKVRTDKAPEECLWEQFNHARVNKGVLTLNA